MPMKVEIFQSEHVSELQKQINNWLGKHPDIHVDRITQSQVQDGQDYGLEIYGPLTICITFCIWYTEKS
jgi:hypothetical protein